MQLRGGRSAWQRLSTVTRIGPLRNDRTETQSQPGFRWTLRLQRLAPRCDFVFLRGGLVLARPGQRPAVVELHPAVPQHRLVRPHGRGLGLGQVAPRVGEVVEGDLGAFVLKLVMFLRVIVLQGGEEVTNCHE